MRKALFLLALFVCTARPLSAQSLIVETATFNNTDQDTWTLAGNIAYGVPFYIDTTTLVTKVGVSNLNGTGTFYAAIVRASASGLPDGAPFNDADVMGHVVFTAGGGDQRVPLSATLTPGHYTLVVGAGVKYGVFGDGLIGSQGQVHNPAFSVFYTFSGGSWSPVYGYYTSGPDPLRFIVEGASEHQAILDAVATRASQASVDALGTTIGTLSTSMQVTNLGASIGNAFTALTGVVNANAAETNGNIAALSGGTSLAQIANALAGKANEASVAGLGGQVAEVNNNVLALGTNLAGLATANDVSTAAASVSAAVSSRASQASVDAIADSLGTSGNNSIAMAIERALADGRRVASFFLPSTVGGQLDQVRAIVDAQLTAGQLAGFDVTRARQQFAKGDVAFASGDFKGAFDYYASAYQQLIK